MAVGSRARRGVAEVYGVIVPRSTEPSEQRWPTLSEVGGRCRLPRTRTDRCGTSASARWPKRCQPTGRRRAGHLDVGGLFEASLGEPPPDRRGQVGRAAVPRPQHGPAARGQRGERRDRRVHVLVVHVAEDAAHDDDCHGSDLHVVRREARVAVDAPEPEPRATDPRSCGRRRAPRPAPPAPHGRRVLARGARGLRGRHGRRPRRCWRGGAPHRGPRSSASARRSRTITSRRLSTEPGSS